MTDRSTPQGEIVWPAPRTFFGAPAAGFDQGDPQVALLGVPFDGGTPQPGNRTGQKLGPAAVRLASWEQFEAAGSGDSSAGSGWYDVESDRDYLVGVTMADLGDVAIQGADVEGNFARITEAARRICSGSSTLVAVGGDHSISYPLVCGLGAFEPLDVVALDAHADFMDELDGARLSGASELRRICELDFVRSVTTIGIRNAAREEMAAMRELSARWATSAEVIERGAEEIVAELVPESQSLYVSIDLDVLDMSLVPGTTLPEPDGLSYRAVRELLVALARRAKVIGFDVAELNPPFDPSGGTARVASWLITHFLSEIFERPR